jgi:hypothetical protein
VQFPRPCATPCACATVRRRRDRKEQELAMSLCRASTVLLASLPPPR